MFRIQPFSITVQPFSHQTYIQEYKPDFDVYNATEEILIFFVYTDFNLFSGEENSWRGFLKITKLHWIILQRVFGLKIRSSP